MIERVRGIVESVDESGLVLRTGDFCIRLMASRNLTARLVAGRTEDLPVQLVVQLEGNRLTPILIAFADDIERDVYEALVSVSGVGARGAVKALARPAGDIASAVVAGDERFLSTLPGIGKARARQIIAALQDRLSREYTAAPVREAPDGGAASEARIILSQIGIAPVEADSLISKATAALPAEPAPSAADIVREALRARSRR